ncbi:MAG: hypothetical protein AB7G11_17095 [Phycisphaerales bacterium]
MVLYLAADLLWSSRIRSIGDEIGVPMRPVRTLEMLEARLGDSDVKGVVLDLDAAETALAMIGRLRGEAATPRDLGVRIVTWGPHVAVDLLSAAKQAGADVVLTRGAFNSRLPELLRELEGER